MITLMQHWWDGPVRAPDASLSILTAIFPYELGLAGFMSANEDGNGGDNWSYKTHKAALKSSLPTN